MILSSPFSRHHRTHQTWTNGTGGGGASSTLPHRGQPHSNQRSSHHLTVARRPSPKQPAPERPQWSAPNDMNNNNNSSSMFTPASQTQQHPQQRQQPDTTGGGPFRSHTLNRLDLLKRRQQQQQQLQRRNLSSLGHYNQNHDQLNNGYLCSDTSRLVDMDIYAPASIASPAEFRRPQWGPPNPDRPQPTATTGAAQLEASQHYAATSYRGPPAGGSECEGRSNSGRESALGQLIERFGASLRRRSAKWSLASSSTRRSQGRPASSSSGFYSTQGTPPGGLADTTATARSTARGGQYKLGKSKPHEADEIYAEGSRALEGNARRRLLEHQLDADLMQEGETRTLIDEVSRCQPDYQQLINTLINWLNDELAEQRIIVRDLQEDLYDGQVLCKLVEKLNQIKLDLVEVTQNEATQRYKLQRVLETLNRSVFRLQARWARPHHRWSVEGIHSKNMVEIICLLATLAHHYGAPIKLPPNVCVSVLVVQKYHGQLVRRSHQVQLTERQNHDYAASSKHHQLQQQRDAFDTLFEFAPEKLDIVKQTLVKFVDRHLAKCQMGCNGQLDPEQFSDGLLLVFLIASLEDYFVPLGNLFTSSNSSLTSASPNISGVKHQVSTNHGITSFTRESLDTLPYIDANNNYTPVGSNHLLHSNDVDDGDSCDLLDLGLGSQQPTALEQTSYINTQPIEKLHNVNVAFQLMEEAGLEIRAKVRAEDVVNGDLKSVLRVLYALFSRYKHV